MRDYEPLLSFGEDAAKPHDQRGDEREAVKLLKGLAGGGPALELGIGTGRIALPLAAEGVRVDGVDISEPMVKRLRSKPGGDRLSVVIGDFADLRLSGSYSLVYVVWNTPSLPRGSEQTLFNLETQNDQARCFENVAAHLEPKGVFVVEAYVPAFLHRLHNDQSVEAESIERDEVRLDVVRHDAANQRIEESHVSLSSHGVHLNPVVQRYAWPSELDLMARLAGLELRQRWGGWSREPFTSSSDRHVSVYGR